MSTQPQTWYGVFNPATPTAAIHVYPSEREAEARATVARADFPITQGQVVVLPVTIVVPQP